MSGTPARIGLLGGRGGALTLGATLAHGARREAGAAIAVLAAPIGIWPEAGPPGLPGTRPARRLAASLVARDVPAQAVGRLVHVALGAGSAQARAQLGRLLAAAEIPVVVCVGPCRDARAEALLEHLDSTVVALPGRPCPALEPLLAGERGTSVLRAVPSKSVGLLALAGIPLAARRPDHESGQALLLVLAALLATLLLAVAAGALARGTGARADRQGAADLAALAAARSLADDHADVTIVVGDGAGEDAPPGLDRERALQRAVRAARATASRNAADGAVVTFPAGTPPGLLPLRVRVVLRADPPVVAEAEAVPPASAVLPGGAAGAGQYAGPLEHRDGKPMRPDVARAYDRMRATARADGVSLVVVSGFRSDAEQAVLFARNPNPKWVAPPGQSLHRLGTELDIGPESAYGWLARHARRFGFVQRYSWEPWHYGFVRNPGTASVGYGRAARRGSDGRAGTVFPAWVPERWRPVIARAAQRWNVGAVLLAAQLRIESGFDPSARSRAGAQGIAQFMPGTARQYGLRDPFDPVAAIDAQAHLMRDLLRDFGAVPLALAAYNAGPVPVQRCRCAGPYAETRAYVAAILGLVLGTGDVGGLAATQMTVRLVR